MELLPSPRATALAGNAALRGWNRARGLRSGAGFRLGAGLGGPQGRRRSPGTGGPVRCSSEAETRPRLAAARVVYGVAPAMGHNQESHPESHFRVRQLLQLLRRWNSLQEMLFKADS
ncbi:uncharacterized protein LOC120287507 [Eucalyptus grandis]|uniref:uncharacterized protein LOC120287507 n=1 Tax=Eucalyptus grandis TaxID=71139 RepID=UPI00192E7FC8|nr:uncharacterized protein LOC120287507 [Eucalyptus grandis]